MPKTHRIYVFGFSRIQLREAYELFMEKEGTAIDGQERLELLFGKPPYSFTNPTLMYECAPMKEFSITTLTKARLHKEFAKLPDYLQEMFKGKRLGFFVDNEGRTYKHEFDKVWSVYIPFVLRSRYHTSILREGDIVKIRHATEPNVSFLAKVEDTEDQKEATFAVLFAEDSWMHKVGDHPV